MSAFGRIEDPDRLAFARRCSGIFSLEAGRSRFAEHSTIDEEGDTILDKKFFRNNRVVV